MTRKKSSELRAKYHANLHQGARPSIFGHAKELRHDLTEAEEKLWSLLRNRQLKGKKFRRQHPILHYVADFYCHECKLVVELDGHYHKKPEVREYDQTRTTVLNGLGVTVLRFWNEEVINDALKVLSKIENYL